MTPKIQSILSYIGILWLVAFFAGKQERNDISRYHLKQGLGLFLFSIVFNIVLGIVLVMAPALSIVASIFGIIFLTLMVLGIITAANEVKKPLPVIGRLFENRFDFIDK